MTAHKKSDYITSDRSTPEAAADQMGDQARDHTRDHARRQDSLLYLLILVVIVQFSYPITAGNSLLWLLVYQVLYMSLVVAGILVARDSPATRRLLIGLGVIWLVCGVAYTFNQEALWAQLAAYGSIGLFQGTVAWVLLKFIFHTHSVTRNVLYAASAVYLLLGAIFIPVFGIIETLTFLYTGGNHAFTDGVIASGEIFPWQHFSYYSFVNLTTLGYGDILPLTMWARSAATLEACIGVLYTAIIISRLVGLYASQEVSEELSQEVEELVEEGTILRRR